MLSTLLYISPGSEKREVHLNVSLFEKCVSLLQYLEILWKSTWDMVGGGVLELENPEGRGGSSSLGNLDGKEGKSAFHRAGGGVEFFLE